MTLSSSIPRQHAGLPTSVINHRRAKGRRLRDRWFRLLQYSARLVLLSHGQPDGEGWLGRLRGLEAAISDARKLFRITNSAATARDAYAVWKRVWAMLLTGNVAMRFGRYNLERARG